MNRRTALERFTANVDRIDGHWIWARGSRKAAGYGQFQVDGHMVIAHRWSYMTFVGPIPTGHEVDHVCQVRQCVNPEHLEAVTLQENRRRRVENKTHCVNGHEYTPENTYTWRDRDGYLNRRCRACNLAAANRRYVKKADR